MSRLAMTPALVALLVLLLLPAPAGAKPSAVEVGYVESFDPHTEDFAIERSGSMLKVAILAPILKGDIVHVLNPQGKIVLRLVGKPDAVVISQANQDRAIDVDPPEKGFWSGLLTWTGVTVGVFDSEERQQVSASIRGDAVKSLSVPILATPQTVVAGKRSLAIGWVSPKRVQISIASRAGKVVASGKGKGGLWSTPILDWKPGAYQITVADGDDSVVQALQIVPAKKALAVPAELRQPGVPDELREAGTASWLAATDPGYLLEALQQVAADATTVRSARLLTLAFIAGKRPPPPPR